MIASMNRSTTSAGGAFMSQQYMQFANFFLVCSASLSHLSHVSFQVCVSFSHVSFQVHVAAYCSGPLQVLEVLYDIVVCLSRSASNILAPSSLDVAAIFQVEAFVQVRPSRCAGGGTGLVQAS